MRRIASTVMGLALLVAVGAAGYWAGTNAIVPPELPVSTHATQTYTVSMGTVGRDAKVAVTSAWTTELTLFGNASGVVTTVRHEPGALAQAGDVVATVELRPVVVAQGRVPMFRTLKKDVRGPDVRQLQQLLRAKGFLKAKATGRFDPATIAATQRWQRSVGARQTGVVAPADLLFVERLPARLEVLVATGSRVNPGDAFVRVLGATPSFTATVSGSTRAELATGMTVTITAPDDATAWTGVLGTFEATPDGRYIASISGDLCAGACDTIPVQGETALAGKVVLVPERTGVVVPVSALVQLPSGATAVMLPNNTIRGVTVVAEADGFAIVKGIDAGATILLPAAPSP